MKLAQNHLVRAAIATSWNYGGRALGLGWTALIISRLGIGDYGRYAIAIAAAAIINAAVDNAFLVRSLRIDDDRFQQERCARALFGITTAAVGAVVFTESAMAGFAVLVCAGEQLFNTYKSQYMRSGRPDIAMRFDAIRQFSSIAVAGGYLILSSDPHLSAAAAFYVSPYAVIVCACLTYIPGRRPARPGDARETSILSIEALAAAIYGQGDLLILGMFVGETVTGYYSVALVTAIALSTAGQHYATTFVQGLRASRGALHAAPRRTDVFRAGALTGCVMAAIGVGVLAWGGPREVGTLIAVMSLWVAARTVQYSFIVVLFTQHRDVLRVRATGAAAVGKVAALFPMVIWWGAYGAAVTAVICDLALTSYYHWQIYGHAGAEVPLVEHEGRSA